MSVASMDLSKMSYLELERLIEQAQEHRKAQGNEISLAFGKSFVKGVGQNSFPQGVDILWRLPTVKPASIGLKGDSFEKQVTPQAIDTYSAVRGALGGRQFIAIRVFVSAPSTLTEEKGDFVEVGRVQEAVEIIFQRSTDQKGCYIAATQCCTRTTETIPSTLYASGTMSSEQIQALGQLLQGNEIEAPADPSKSKRLVKMV